MTLLLALSWPAVGQPPSIATRLDQLKAKGVNAEITVFPVGLASGGGQSWDCALEGRPTVG